MIAVLLNTADLCVEVIDLDDEGPYDDTIYRGEREFEFEDRVGDELVYREVVP